MKKVFSIILAVILAGGLLFVVSSGLIKNTSVFIEDYTVAEDGSSITLQVGVSSSMGYIRKVAIHQQEDGKLYLDCYAAFGGPNGRIGAKNTYTLPLKEDTSIIALYRGSNCYETVLQKGPDGSFVRAKPNPDTDGNPYPLLPKGC